MNKKKKHNLIHDKEIELMLRKLKQLKKIAKGNLEIKEFKHKIKDKKIARRINMFHKLEKVLELLGFDEPRMVIFNWIGDDYGKSKDKKINKMESLLYRKAKRK